MADFNAKLGTMGLGLAGEAGEIARIADDFVNRTKWNEEHRKDLISELGDIMWYVAFAARHVLNIRLDTLMPERQLSVYSTNNTSGINHNIVVRSVELSAACGAVADIVKKVLYHGKPYTKDTGARLVVLLKNIVEIVMKIGIDSYVELWSVVGENVTKLADRYKGLKFTTEEFMAKEAASGQ
jgi:hypothetical protein